MSALCPSFREMEKSFSNVALQLWLETFAGASDDLTADSYQYVPYKET